MLVGVSDALEMFFLEFVLFGIGVRVAAPPKLFNEPLAFFIRVQPPESLPLSLRDDVGNIFVEPLWKIILGSVLFEERRAARLDRCCKTVDLSVAGSTSNAP